LVQLISEKQQTRGWPLGGLGSGERWSKKAVVEGCHSLDTTDLKRMNMLAAEVSDRRGSLEWRRGGEREPSSSVSYTLTLGDGSGTLRLLYRVGQPGENLDYPIRLVTTRCHLGGVRWWFLCPLSTNGFACLRRVRKLYLRGRYFGCRHCHELTFTSSQESDSRVYAALRGGLDLGRFDNLARMSVAQLGFALKLLTFEQKRLDRLDKRPNRGRRARGATADANDG
jgi:hypothetical protein